MPTVLHMIPVEVTTTPGEPWWRIVLDVSIAVGTIAAAAAAAFAAWRAGRIAKEDRQAADRRAHEDRATAGQPYVFADIRPNKRTGQLLLLVIENVGRTLAKNVEVSFDPPLESLDFPARFSGDDRLQRRYAVMPPGHRHVYLLDRPWVRFDSDLPMRHRVRVTADGPFGPVEPLEYNLDLTDLHHLDGRGEGAIEDIAKVLAKIEKRLGGSAPRHPGLERLCAD